MLISYVSKPNQEKNNSYLLWKLKVKTALYLSNGRLDWPTSLDIWSLPCDTLWQEGYIYY